MVEASSLEMKSEGFVIYEKAQWEFRCYPNCYPHFILWHFERDKTDVVSLFVSQILHCRNKRKLLVLFSRRYLPDKFVNVLRPPSGASLRQLHRLWKAPGFDAFPPACFANGNDAQNLWQANKARFWNRVHKNLPVTQMSKPRLPNADSNQAVFPCRSFRSAKSTARNLVSPL